MTLTSNIHPHALEANKCLELLDTSRKNGLSSVEAKRRLDTYGFNELGHEEPKSLCRLILEQFDDLLVKILLASAVISFVLAFMENGTESGITAFVEPFVILLILILNAVVGVWQEGNAENALKALKQMQSEKIECLRDGHFLRNFPAKELVPGDIIRV